MHRFPPCYLHFCFIFCFIFCFSSLCVGQNETSTSLKKVETTSSGIVIYKSKGVENDIPKKENNDSFLSASTPISEWTLEQCNDGMDDLNTKIHYLESKNAPESDFIEYRKMKDAIAERLTMLNLQYTK